MKIKLYYLLALCCILTFFLTPKYVSDTPLNYHFLHANIFHLAANIFALFMFKPRAVTIYISFLVATLAYIIDVQIFHTHTYGLSAMLLAMYGRWYIAWKQNPLPIIYSIIIIGMLPHISWHIHLIAFLLSLFVWHFYYKYKK